MDNYVRGWAEGLRFGPAEFVGILPRSTSLRMTAKAF